MDESLEFSLSWRCSDWQIWFYMIGTKSSLVCLRLIRRFCHMSVCPRHDVVGRWCSILLCLSPASSNDRIRSPQQSPRSRHLQLHPTKWRKKFWSLLSYHNPSKFKMSAMQWRRFAETVKSQDSILLPGRKKYIYDWNWRIYWCSASNLFVRANEKGNRWIMIHMLC